MCAASRRRVGAALILLVLSPLAMLLAGCRTPDSSAAAATRTRGPDAYETSGRVGDLRVHLPLLPASDRYPLVIALHSLYHNGAYAQRTFGLDDAADQFGFAVAYPDGRDLSWNAGSCCGRSVENVVDDVGYIRAVISHLEQRYPIDRRRVYLVGLSNGGMLAYRYACTYPGELAGIAVVAGSLQVNGCRPSTPVTVVSVHGIQDRLLPYDGTSWSTMLRTPITSTPDSLAPFRTADRCPVPAPPRDTTFTGSEGQPLVPGRPVGEGARAIKEETPCLSGARVVEYALPEQGHGWPPLTGENRFETAAVIWAVLADARSQRVGPDL